MEAYILKPEELVASIFADRAGILQELFERCKFGCGFLLLVLWRSAASGAGDALP